MFQSMLAKLPHPNERGAAGKTPGLKLARPPSSPSIKGNVDGFDNGRLGGWAHDPRVAGRRLELSVLDAGERVGGGRADGFRADLQQASIGDGRHAFSIALDDAVFDGHAHRLEVIETVSRDVVGRFELTQRAFADIHLDTPDAHVIRGRVRASDARSVVREDQLNPGIGDDPRGAVARIVENGQPGPLVVELLIDDAAVGQAECRLEPGAEAAGFVFELPPGIHDDTIHLFSARLVGRSSRSTRVAARIASVMTDWRHIAVGASSGTLSALSGIAARRYRSLQAQIERATRGEIDAVGLEAVRIAHDSVVRGPENRGRLPDLALDTSEEPLVSVVVPVHNEYAHTHHCLASIVLNQSAIPYEVVLVDDLSDDATTGIERHVSGIRVIRNAKNLRFLRTAERGADAARGKYVLFLNNDTEVTHGWLEALLDTFERFADVGMAGSKLIYPSGKLQEAGGIVWGSGKPWNIGNGENAEHPAYNYVRDVDYLSGAAMMVTAEAWKAVGGFSKEFVPAYYEDTDLAFKVRELGLRTLYCPASVIVHYEGMSNGTELNAGVKRFQSVNAPKFRAKWRRAYRHNGAEGRDMHLEKDRGIDFRVLMLDHQFPRPDNDAGSYAAVQEMRLLQELGCKITFIPHNMAHGGKYTHDLQRNGVECIHGPFYRNVAHFLEERGREFDAVYVTRYNVADQLLDAVRRHTRAKVIFNNADLHFLREMRAAFAAREVDLAGPTATRERELSVMRRVDAVLSYNEIEHSVIASHNFREDNIFHCPWVLSGERSAVGFAGRADIAFLGGFAHKPNVEAVRWFVESVMPGLIETRPDIRLRVYGSKVPREIEELASENVVIEGFVESLSSVFDTCRVFVAPLLSGAGIKGKVLESMSHGVPAVLSPVAAEATGLAHGASTLIASNADRWVEHIVALHDDEALWNRIADGCSALASTNYSRENGLERMGEVLRYLELDPASDRRPTFRSDRHVA